MALRDEIADPWTILAAGLAAGAAWAVGVPVAAAAGVGVAVAGAKAVAGMFGGRAGSPRPRMLPIRDRSPEAAWLRRAERAMRSFTELARSVRPGPIAERCTTIGGRARTTIEAMHRLAGQTSAVASALDRIDVDRLRADLDRLGRDVRAEDEDIRQEMQHSMDAVRAQLAVHDRLVQAGRTLLARLESGAIGLEGLVARLAEVLALSETATTPQGVHRIDELADELEALRGGLVETEDMSRRALIAYESQGRD